MTNDYIKNIKSATNGTYSNNLVQKSATSTSNSSESKKVDGLGMDGQEFLTLLVNQLQQQDPLNPMDSQQFAAQLATFSQLEQLISINEKIDNLSSSSGEISSMASFLGREVVLQDQTVNISSGNGPNLLVDIPEGAQSARIDFKDENNQVVGSQQIEEVQSGEQVIDLDNINVPDGAYDVRFVAVTADGRFVDLDTKVTGTVEGFVMEPNPALIVDGQQVAMDQVAEVRTATKK